jgi:hypothetical protein
MSVLLWVTLIVIAPLGCVQILGESHSVAEVDNDKICIPDSEVGGSCPAVGSSSVGMLTAGAMVIRGVVVVLTTETVGPAPETPVSEAAEAPSSVPAA